MTHTSTEQPELLPCPFCGTNPTLEGDGEILWIVCHADSACRRGGMVFAIKKDEMEIGINSWNLRAPAAQSQRAPLLFNPFNGKPRHPLDVKSDPNGLLIATPGAELRATRINQEKLG